MVKRKGLGKGQGSGYKNMIPNDPSVHSQSAKGIKQPQKMKSSTKSILAELGIVEEKGKLPEGFKEIEFDPSVEGEVSKTKRFAGKVGARGLKIGKQLLEKAKELKKLDEELLKKKQEGQMIEDLKSVHHPKLNAIEKQRARVEQLKEQITLTDDPSVEDRLYDELDREQDELAKLHEEVTNIKLEEFSIPELRRLAINHKDEGFGIIGSGNPYEDEILRRIEKQKELDKKIQDAQKGKTEEGLF